MKGLKPPLSNSGFYFHLGIEKLHLVIIFSPEVWKSFLNGLSYKYELHLVCYFSSANSCLAWLSGAALLILRRTLFVTSPSSSFFFWWFPLGTLTCFPHSSILAALLLWDPTAKLVLFVSQTVLKERFGYPCQMHLKEHQVVPLCMCSLTCLEHSPIKARCNCMTGGGSLFWQVTIIAQLLLNGLKDALMLRITAWPFHPRNGWINEESGWNGCGVDSGRKKPAFCCI